MLPNIDTNEPITNKISFSPPSDKLLSNTSSFDYYINSPPSSVQSEHADIENSLDTSTKRIDLDQLEESYDLNYLTLPIACSQDYNENFSLSDEIEQVFLTNGDDDDNNNTIHMPIPIEAIKIEIDADTEKALRYDSMIDGSARTTVEFQDSQELIPMEQSDDSESVADITNIQLIDNNTKVIENRNIIGSILVEHNYSPYNIKEIVNTNGIKMIQNQENIPNVQHSMQVMGKEPLARRLARRRLTSGLKLKIQPANMSQQKTAQNVVSTPEITNYILDMETENEKFDLIKFIDSEVSKKYCLP